jgi:hypothetical protein
MAQGSVGFIGLGLETTWGTAVAATDYFKAMSENLTATKDRFEVENIVNTMTEPDDSGGVERVAGQIVATGHPVSIGHFLAGTFGQSSVAIVLSSELWAVSFQAREMDVSTANSLPGYTIEVFRDVTSSQQYDGCVFAGCEFSIAPNQGLQATANIIGKGTQNIAATTATFPGSPTGYFSFDTASLSIGGAGTAVIEALTISVNNNLEGIPALEATKEISKIKRSGPVTTNLSGTLSFDDITEYNRFINQDEFAMTVNMTKADSFSILFDIPRMIYTAFPLGIGGRERLTVGFEGKARYLTTSAAAMVVTLTTVKSDFT